MIPRLRQETRGPPEEYFRMAEEGKLLIAGPFMDDTGNPRDLLFDVRSIEEAQKLTETDPCHQSKESGHGIAPPGTAQQFPLFGSTPQKGGEKLHCD
ncbi:MAG: hypothetical protein IPO07_26180 [Haliscomenobacter sp.]|nr:hypothetical protein [Haliscomenobacter sp.]MBK9491897.1 hypothetical protein [Haliscomenobacter sp.]